MSKHTAGPWEFDGTDNCIEHDGCVVCYVNEHKNINTVARNHGEEFSHADARLIAAAPEFYDAGKEALELLSKRDITVTDLGLVRSRLRLIFKKVDG